MKFNRIVKQSLTLCLMLLGVVSHAQFSPGKLSEAHAHLEGMKNCTECHELGNAVSQTKCLSCHTEIAQLQELQRGFHYSDEVRNSSCISCHSEHHGRNFDAVRFDQDDFDHNKTGYALEGAHAKVDCRECHLPENIQDDDLKTRTNTFLGLQSSCLSCHDDYHRGTLSNTCTNCHTLESWTPASNFDHDQTDFNLTGAHIEVDCKECHKEESRQGEKFQRFADVAHQNCTDCHEDQHRGRLGTDCLKCHNDLSWSIVNAEREFDHSLTRYNLVGLHAEVACQTCHVSDFSPLPFEQCIDCHEDYHEGELINDQSKFSDCNDCHSVEHKFSWSSYSFLEHAESPFPLEGAHIATPCTECHQPESPEQWTFKFETNSCVSCHENIHEGYLSNEWMQPEGCSGCHNTETWSDVQFDHGRTNWPLEGLHVEVACAQCHFVVNTEEQVFKGLDESCTACHEDVHAGQFDEPAQPGKVDCSRCHSTHVAWSEIEFDHSRTEFPLEGRHNEIECKSCHANVIEGNLEYVQYKIPERSCIDCHGS